MSAERQPTRRMVPSDWETMPDEAILQIRVRDLGLKLENSPLHASVVRLYEELEAHGIQYHPPCYLADEWFCPDKVPLIGLPFCLAHPRLTRIEMRMMYEVEGGAPDACMKLLRHECGHALNYAYMLYRRTRWRELFGQFGTPYFSSYHFRPYSRHYVVHLEGSYAQAHPDEDFAETFAVWLTPDSRWEEKYRGWPVLRKLRYVDRLMRRIGGAAPLVTRRDMPFSAERMTSTLAAYYERKQKYMGDDFPGYYDESLRRVFCPAPPEATPGRAGAFVRRHRKLLTDSVTTWTGYRKYDVRQLVDRLARRCDALRLHQRAPDPQTLVELTALITAAASNALRVGPRRERA